MVPDAAGQVALSGARVRAIEAVLARVSESRPACRVVVLRGGDGQFCRGMDLGEAVARTEQVEELRSDLYAYASCVQSLIAGPAATVSLVDGEVLGGGVGLMAACDIVVATKRATIALPELTVGLVPAIVLPALHRRVGVQRTRWLALTGKRLTAEQALAIGLVDAVVEDAEALEKQLRRELKSLLRTRPEAVARLKQINEQAAASDLATALGEGVARTASDMIEPEVLGAVTAMAEGELPPWFTRYRRSPT